MTPPALGGVNHWTGAGPDGGTGSIAIDPVTPTRLFAGGNGSVFRSTNGGTSWSRLALENDCLEIPDVTIDPHRPATVYVATSCGLHRSDDGGTSWTRIPASPLGSVSSIVVDPMTSDVLWGIPTSTYVLGNGGLYRSTDRGESWTTVGLADATVRSLAVAATSPRRIVALSSQGLHVSADGGITWSLETDLVGEDVDSLVVDPHDPARVHAAGWGGLFTSTDGGASWARAPVSPRRIVALPTRPTTLYGVEADLALVRSVDAGATWERRPTTGGGYFDPRAIAVSPAALDAVYVAGVAAGVLRGSYADARFVLSSQGLVTSSIETLAAHPSAAGDVYAALQYGIAHTSDGGRSWASLPTRPEHTPKLAIVPTEPPTIWAGGYFDVARSTDGGVFWSDQRVPGPNDGVLVALAADPSHPAVAYAGVDGSGVYRTANGGDEWTPANEGIVRAENGSIDLEEDMLVVDPQTPSRVYVVANGRLHRSTDSAAHWTPLPLPGLWVVNLFALDPQEPTRLYALGGFGSYLLLTSDDAGASWTSTSFALADFVFELLVDPLRAGGLWARTSSDVLMSRDRGQHWSRLRRALPPMLPQALALDRVLPGVAYVGLGGGGVMAYEDRCGDGSVDAFETCDDGNTLPGDACPIDCTRERRGDGVVDPGEECDDGNFTDGDGCDSNQTVTACGNGIVTEGTNSPDEQCDDGNVVLGDGCEYCSRTCTTAADCDDRNLCTGESCVDGHCSYGHPHDVTAIAQCSNEMILAAGGCENESIPARFVARVKRVTARLTAFVADDGGRARALRSLRRLARRTHALFPHVTRQCISNLATRVRETKQVLADAWPR